MDVRVSSRNVRVTEAIEEIAVAKVGQLDRLVDGMDQAEVHLYEERNPRISDKDWCEVTVSGHGHHVRAKASAADPTAAIDAAVAKLERQLRKLKTKLGRHRQGTKKHSPRHEAAVEAAPVVEVESDDATLADDTYVTKGGEEVLKRKRFETAPMSVEEAIERMDLLGHDFFLFTNELTGDAAVLYRRDYGGLGLIDYGSDSEITP